MAFIPPISKKEWLFTIGYTRFVPPAPPAVVPGEEEFDDLDNFLDELVESSMVGLLLLKDGPPTPPTVLRSVGTLVHKRLDDAGHAYSDLVAQRANGGVKVVKKERVVVEGDGGADPYAPASQKERADMATWCKNGDYYHLLGLQKVGLASTEQDIRKAFKRQQLRFHPDKAKAGGGGHAEGKAADEETDNVYRSIQRAHDSLIDPARRRAFESTFDFDEAIPKGDEKGDFFEVYAPVFERNARFSTPKPVPMLGGPEASDGDIKSFYKFWFAFDSWREFVHLGKEKVDEADGRDERREREKKNKADAAKGKKADVKRVADLVDRAYARDPRVKAMLAREEAEKKAEKNKKNAGKFAAEAEEARVKAEAAKAKAEKEEAEKAATKDAKFSKEREKKHLTRSKAALRKVGTPLPAGTLGDPFTATDVNIEYLLARLEAPAVIALHRAVLGDAAAEAVAAQAVADAEKLCSGDKKAGAGAAAAPTASPSSAGGDSAREPNLAPLLEAIKSERDKDPAFKLSQDAAATAAAAAAATQVEAAKKAARPWEEAELVKLVKACKSFPAGTQRRWQLVSEAVNKDATTKRSVAECSERAGLLTEGEGEVEKVEAAPEASA